MTNCRSRSVGFFRSQLIWIYTVCKGRAYPGLAGPGLTRSLPLCFFSISGPGNQNNNRQGRLGSENGGNNRQYSRNNSNDSTASTSATNGTRYNGRNFINQNKKDLGSNQNKRELGPVREGKSCPQYYVSSTSLGQSVWENNATVELP